MKVLVASPYFYDFTHTEFSRTSSGFGYMVKDILDSVSKYDDIYVFTHQLTNGYQEKFNVIKHNKFDILKGLRAKDFYLGLKDALKNSVDMNTRLHYFYYQINKGAFINAIREIKPKVVHIHGLTFQTKPFIEACNELKVKYLVTLHGLNGLNETILLPDIEKKYEKETLEDLYKNNVPVTVVSSGIQKKIGSQYGIGTSNIKIILNGTTFQPSTQVEISKEKYEIVCIGSISYRKNQTQLVDSLCCIPKEYKRRLHISFYGVDSDGIDLARYIQDRGMQDCAEYKGFVNREEMKNVWENANLNVVMSKEEGFGLSIIEGFMHGIPTATFSDLDAIKDIFNAEAIEFFYSRACEDVSAGIIRCIERTFNKEKIVEWGMNFSLDKIGKQYSNLYDVI